MVSYQLLVFGAALVIFGILFAFLNDVFYDMQMDGTMGYIGTNDAFVFGQKWVDFLWKLIPSIVFITGGFWCVARAMKG